MTAEQKVKAFDDICSRIDVSCGRDNDPESAKNAMESILHYTLWIYAWCTMDGDEILSDRDTEYEEDWDTYDNMTRWLFCPIQEEVRMHWYKAGKKILQPNSN
jgi:hypothetical protein